ncbi:histidine phosphatase family protein [Candidatus Woesearchaeota archaeon]|nr:histidine phosphatase family protein [Candidatus Woesearchaeota archaeon]
MLDLYFFRHGECEMNLAEPAVFGGRSNNSPLTEKGVRQAELLGERFVRENWSFDEIYASPAVRAKDTAVISCSKMGVSLDKIVIIDELQERHWGDYDGKLRSEILTPDIILEQQTNFWNYTPPNGESLSDASKRYQGWIMNALLPKKGKIAIFSHGTVMRCFLKEIMSFDDRFVYKILIENTGLIQLAYNGDWRINKVNDSSHLINLP